MKFKVGDIVRRTDDHSHAEGPKKNDIGVVTWSEDDKVEVRYFNGINCMNYCYFLELVTEKRGENENG